MATPDFTTVTEVPGVMATRSELSQMYTRYHWAAQFVPGKRVLELGCGSGPGLGYFLQHGAARVVGTDVEDRNLAHARTYYAGRPNLDLAVVDAQALPYPDASFDVVMLFEAIYYLPDAAKFLAEARRVLAPGGVLLISTVNREWPQFNPSPFSHWYPTAAEMKAAMEKAGFTANVRGAYPDRPHGLVKRMVSWVRRTAVSLRLIPNTMKGKEFLKRVFYGKLSPVPAELKDDAGYELEPLMDVGAAPAGSTFVFLYAEGRVS